MDLSLRICHRGVSEDATKLSDRVPGSTDAETRGRKATGKLPEPASLGQARAGTGWERARGCRPDARRRGRG